MLDERENKTNQSANGHHDDKSNNVGSVEEKDDPTRPSNEYVLNVAFVTFVVFLIIEAVFAIVANSESMMADAQAMSVDALTYLFNLCAERIKNRPLSEEELALPAPVREHRRELKRLYLELVPPTISVTALVYVTISVLRESWSILFGDESGDDPDVSVGIMLSFSAANLLLDIVNVHCFAQAKQAFGLDQFVSSSHDDAPDDLLNEKTPLVISDEEKAILAGNKEELERNVSFYGKAMLNLNMCSAWTHVFADTLRSTAVLIAAGLAYFCSSLMSGATADALAAVAVSIIILITLIPLICGLLATIRKIFVESQKQF